jgi:tungstate transport system substrate-binding protein
MRLAALLVVVGLLPGWVGCGDGATRPTRLRLATTTSTDNSGLLEWLLPPFEEAAYVRVEVIAVGTGKALELGRRGDADVLLVHARSREDAFVAEGDGIDRRDVMWNDFVLLGPPADPAGIRGMTDAAAALERIGATRARFISRGDDSGTHIRERGLWEAAGGRPEWEAYWETGQGMGATLTVADEKHGYVLADRGTVLAFGQKVELEILVEGDPALRNPYGVLRVNPERHPHVETRAAVALVDYLTSPAGQARIAAFRKGGAVLFHPYRVD